MMYRDGAAIFVKENKRASWMNMFANTGISLEEYYRNWQQWLLLQRELVDSGN